ncbi:hypothetical protein HDU84_008312 [Entophlyctis sp. JEL0112]|nr:hypothetical protein HDU84_008312 [Entophlyctis sp. JEL0112]
MFISTIGVHVVLPAFINPNGGIFERSINSVSFFMLLRGLELLTYPKNFVRSWSFGSFVEFLMTSDNDRIRAKYPKHRSPKHTVPYKSQNAAFYVREISKIVILICTCGMIKVYFERNGFKSVDGTFVPLHDFRSAFDHLLFGMVFYTTLDIFYTSAILWPTFAFGAPYVPVFDFPMLSTSLTDFWSRRWNIPLQRSFQRIAYFPVLNFLGSGSHKPSFMHRALAVLATFAFSGIFHEYTLWVLLPRGSYSVGWNMMFFCLHGLLCILEGMLLQRNADKRLCGLREYCVSAARTAAVAYIVAMTSPLFLHPYQEGGILEMRIFATKAESGVWALLTE